jgi:hypothetical protein
MEFEKRALRICGPNREEMKKKSQKMHAEELHKLRSSPDVITMII